MADMNGQVALVTGGIRGIGLAICERLMNRGVKVAAGYASNAGDARQFADKYADHSVSVHQGNIGRDEDCERVIREVLDRHGQLDITTHPSGTGGYTDLVHRASPQRIPGTTAPVPVASAADTIASKTAAGRPKDIAMLAALRRELAPWLDRL